MSEQPSWNLDIKFQMKKKSADTSLSINQKQKYHNEYYKADENPLSR